MKKSIIFVVILALLGVFSWKVIVHRRSKIEREELEGKKQVFIEKFRTIKTNLGITEEPLSESARMRIQALLASGKRVPLTHIEKEYLRGYVIAIDDGSSECEFEMSTGKLIEFYSPLFGERETYPDKIEFTRTESEILRLSADYLRCLTGIPPPENYVPQTKYWEADRDWSVLYWRTLNGYKYFDDYLKISIDDRSGNLLSFGRALESKTCLTEVKASKDEAEKLAVQIATRWAPKFFPFEFTGSHIASTELWIINPNYLFTRRFRGFGHGNAIHSTLDARLAYMVEIRFEMHPVEEGNSRGIVVFIDAATGKILGGYY